MTHEDVIQVRTGVGDKRLTLSHNCLNELLFTRDEDADIPNDGHNKGESMAHGNDTPYMDKRRDQRLVHVVVRTKQSHTRNICLLRVWALHNHLDVHAFNAHMHHVVPRATHAVHTEDLIPWGEKGRIGI